MALINCPECGRNNISDTAEQCPECGYAVRQHFEREKRKAYFAEQEKILEAKKQIEYSKLEEELNYELEQIDELQPSKKPVKPNKSTYMFYYNDSLSMLSWALIVGVVLFFLCFVSFGIFAFLLALLLVLGVPIAAYITYMDYGLALQVYERDYAEWEEQQRDWDAYLEKRRDEIRNKYKDVASNMANYGTRNIPVPQIQIQENQLKCPVCNSANIKRISTLNRTVSVAAVGLASSKIGKQYECNDCKHKW